MNIISLFLFFCFYQTWGMDAVDHSSESIPLTAVTEYILYDNRSNKQSTDPETTDTLIDIDEVFPNDFYKNILCLTNDIWTEIMLRLDMQDVKALSMVCRKTYDVYAQLPSEKLKRHLWKTYGDLLSLFKRYPDLFFPNQERSRISVDDFQELNVSLEKTLSSLQSDHLEKDRDLLRERISTLKASSSSDATEIESIEYLKDALSLQDRFNHYLLVCKDDLSHYILIHPSIFPQQLDLFLDDNRRDDTEVDDLYSRFKGGCYCTAPYAKQVFWGFYTIPTLTLLIKFILNYPHRNAILSVLNSTMYEDIKKHLFLMGTCTEQIDLYWINRTIENNSYFVSVIGDNVDEIKPPRGQGELPNFILYIIDTYQLNKTLWRPFFEEALKTAPWDHGQHNASLFCQPTLNRENLFCFKEPIHGRVVGDLGPSFITDFHYVETDCAITSWNITFSVFTAFTCFVFLFPKFSSFAGTLTYLFPTRASHIGPVLAIINSCIVLTYIVWFFFLFG